MAKKKSIDEKLDQVLKKFVTINDALEKAQKENEELKAKINDYELLAQIAAECTMDLDANLSDAHKEYMDGDIPNGAYQYVLSRHANLYAMLHKCGFTEKHPIFEFPCRPKNPVAT